MNGDEPLNGSTPDLEPVPAVESITVRRRPDGNVDVLWTPTTGPEFFAEAARVILEARRQVKAQAEPSRLLLPRGLLR